MAKETNDIKTAFLEGFKVFIGKFWQRASDQAFLIIVLLLIVAGLVFWVNRLQEENRALRLEYKQEIADLRNEYRRNDERLNTRIDTLLKSADDCNEARIRAESQNAVLLRLLNAKR